MPILFKLLMVKKKPDRFGLLKNRKKVDVLTRLPQFGFYGLLGVRYRPQPLLRNQLAGVFANAIRAVFNPNQGRF